MRGYRMARATHGISSGHYYYEVLILDPPPVSEIVAALPPNIRMGQKLQDQMQQALLEEKNQNQNKKNNPTNVANNDNATKTTNKSTSTTTSTTTNTTNTTTFGGHVRLGWSMRTGDLQAPVGYDKWSYGIRDIMGSKIHCSKREDHWGGEGFGPGDVIGCAIILPPKDQQQQQQQQKQNQKKQKQQQQPEEKEDTDDPNDNTNNTIANNGNHILFFKNGLPMGEFVISKGKREGGAAFEGIPDGVYYPAISLYMGASVQVNMGPHFIYPPRKLPASIQLKSKSLRPVSDLSQPPMTAEDATFKITKEKVFFRGKPDMMTKFTELVQTEVQVLQDAYQTHRRTHVQEVYAERKRRNVGVSTADLEDDEFFVAKNEEEKGVL
jgi:hypothetical protein